MARLDKNFTTETVSDLLEKVTEVENVTLGSADDTQALIYANMEQYRQKIQELNNVAANSANQLLGYLNKMSLAKPADFQHLFSR